MIKTPNKKKCVVSCDAHFLDCNYNSNRNTRRFIRVSDYLSMCVRAQLINSLQMEIICNCIKCVRVCVSIIVNVKISIESMTIQLYKFLTSYNGTLCSSVCAKKRFCSFFCLAVWREWEYLNGTSPLNHPRSFFPKKIKNKFYQTHRCRLIVALFLFNFVQSCRKNNSLKMR